MSSGASVSGKLEEDQNRSERKITTAQDRSPKTGGVRPLGWGTRSWAALFGVRRGSSFNAFDAGVMVIYSLVLAFAIHHYQPFADEAQAWLIARDCSLRELLLRRLHYEGAPALWPLFVRGICRLHLPYASVNWIAGGLALVGIYVLLRFSPFPRLF